MSSSWIALRESVNQACLDTLGRAVVYQPKVGDPKSITGIIRNDIRPESTDPGVWVFLFISIADLGFMPQTGDQVVIDSVAYKIYDVTDDNEGGATLGMHK